jgi:hypothetical protein
MAARRVIWRSLRRLGWPGYWASTDGRVQVEEWVVAAHPDLPIVQPWEPEWLFEVDPEAKPITYQTSVP